MDRLLKAVAFDNQASVTVLKTNELVQKAIDIHNLTPLTAAALGRTLTMTAYLCSCLKNSTDSMSVSIKGDGVGGKITTSGESSLKLRGSIENPAAELPLKPNGKLDVAGCVGKGSLTVVKDMGLKMPFVGSVELSSGEIAEDFAEYFMQSEQTPTAVALGVKVTGRVKCLGAGGVIIQPLPGASEETIDEIEKMLPKLQNVSDLMEKNTAEQVLEMLFGKCGYEEFIPVYECRCNRSYIDKVLIAMGKDELDDIVKTEGKVSLHCHFCNSTYDYDGEQVELLFKGDEKQ